MKTITQFILRKHGTTTAAWLMLGLGVYALANIVQLVHAAPPKWIPSQAVSIYPSIDPTHPLGFAHTASELTHEAPWGAPGTVNNYTDIGWGLNSEGKAAHVQLRDPVLGDYNLGIYVHIHLNIIKAGQETIITAVQVAGLGGPPGGPWPYHDTEWIPCTPVAFTLGTPFTIHIHTDDIPVWRHATQKSNSPRVLVVGHMALGDLVISPMP